MNFPSYLPNTQPNNNSTSQIRRRVNDTVTAINGNTQTVSAIQQKVNDFGKQIAEAQGTQATFPNLTSAPIHTTANAGGAAALPSSPAGYTTIQINGKSYKIALYEV